VEPNAVLKYPDEPVVGNRMHWLVERTSEPSKGSCLSVLLRVACRVGAHVVLARIPHTSWTRLSLGMQVGLSSPLSSLMLLLLLAYSHLLLLLLLAPPGLVP